MPLPCIPGADLQIPPGVFSSDGLAVLLLQGGRYGGDWHIAVTTAADQTDCLGSFQTDTPRKQQLLPGPRYPWLAVETAFIWLTAQAQEHGWRVVGWECLNRHYGPGEAPYFCAAQAIVADATFTPLPGTTYADEMTLDEVMGYSTAREDRQS